MRKLIVLLGIITLAFVSCDRPLTFEKLPQQAQQFINQNFKDVGFLSAMKDDGKYDVVLKDGTEIEFTRKGEWKKVDCHLTAIPEAVIPPTILTYVKAQFPDNFIVKIDKDSREYEVELNNNIDLMFDKNGNFMYAD